MSQVKGMITSIKFEGEDNFKVVELNRKVTVKGRLFFDVEKGDEILCEGDFDENGVLNIKKAYQYEVTDEDLIRGILSSGRIKYVGDITAYKIVEEFGKDTFYVIERKPDKLTQIDGISSTKAKEIRSSWVKIKRSKDIIIKLMEFGFSANTAILLNNKFKTQVITKVKKNPYIALDTATEMSFVEIDDIAVFKMAIEPLSNLRIKEAIIYFLNRFHDKTGSTIIPVPSLVKNVANSIEVSNTHITDQIKALKTDGKVFLYKVDGKKHIQTAKYRWAEKLIALRLNELNNQKNINNISLYEKFGEKQNEAIDIFNENNISIIYGRTGSGKTTVAKYIASQLQKSGLSVELLTFTGVMAENLNTKKIKAQTIHKALDYDFVKEKFVHNKNNKILADVFIVDEVSMVDVVTFASLIDAIPKDSKLLLIGDIEQLQSVGAGSLLFDILRSKKFNSTYFSKIYRNKTSPLFHKYQNNIEKLIESENVHLIKSSSDIESVEKLKELLKEGFTNEDVRNKVQVLSPINNSKIGVNALNLVVKNIVNPAKYHNKKRVKFEYRDKVVQTKNNYKKEIYNGEVGIIKYIDDFHTKVLFRNKEVVLDKIEFKDLNLAYTMTIHKSQGSTFDKVILVLPEDDMFFIDINMINTALSRAKNDIFIIGKSSVFKNSILKNNKKTRKTLLTSFIG